jgi:hypothetical protein
MDPDERSCRRSINSRSAEVATCSSNDTSNQQSHNHSTRLHDRRSISFSKNDGHENEEPKTDKLCRTPWKSVRSGVRRAKHIIASSWTRSASSGTTSPILETRLDQTDSDQGDSWTCDKWWKDLLEDFWWGEGHEDFKESTAALGANDCTCEKFSSVVQVSRECMSLP